jgi:hypothetical protein
MAAITPTKQYGGEFAGQKKIKIFSITPGSASDTVDLSSHFSSIDSVMAHLNAGADANLLTIHATVSSTTVTVVTKDAAGSSASDWTGAAATLLVIGEDEGI